MADFELVAAGIAVLIFNGFNIWVYFYEVRIAIGVAILSTIMTLLAVYGLILQIKLRKKAKEICEDARIIKAKVLNCEIFIHYRTFYARANLLFRDGKKEVRYFKCNGFEMKKYKKFGVFIIQAKYLKKEIILRAKEYDFGKL